MADYISREAAIKAVKSQTCWHYNNSMIDEHWIISNIDEIPTADVRPVVRAKWEDETGYIFSNLAQRVYCPACKSFAYFYPITAKNFCPNCGADMREQGAEGGA